MDNQYRPNLPYNQDQLHTYTAEFLSQSQNPSASLAWFDSLIKPWTQPLEDAPPVAVVDLGGSHLRFGIAQSQGNEVSWISPIQREDAINHHQDMVSFTDWLTSKIIPLATRHQVKKLGFIFSYPHQPEVMGNHISAVITAESKGLTVPGFVGTNIGQALLRAAQRADWDLEHLVIINDSIATVLSVYGAEMGLIVGTGGNICSTHPSLPNLRNIEAGNFDGIPYSQAAALIDLYEHPGTQTVEKQTTGRYLYQLLIHQLIIDQIDFRLVKQVQLAGTQHHSKIIDQFADQNYDLIKDYQLSPQQQNTLTTHAQHLLTTSAQAWGLMLASCISLNQFSTDTIKIPYTGGVILNNPSYLETVKDTAAQLSGKSIEMVEVRDPIQGAAVAVLQS